LALVAWIALERTATGFRLRVAGSNPRFSAYAGIESHRYWTPALAASGALHGLAGFFAVAGTYGLCHRGFSGGLGWSAIAVALIARNNPVAIIPAAISFAWLQTGTEAAELRSGLSFEAAALAQAVLFLLVTAKAGLRFLPKRGRP
jgi:simple sugar transport system permease protein